VGTAKLLDKGALPRYVALDLVAVIPVVLAAVQDDGRDQRREEPVAITAALRGAGGYGKTTMAVMACTMYPRKPMSMLAPFSMVLNSWRSMAILLSGQ